MYTKVLAFLALATLANCNDVIVGLKTDGTKFFDENRQANPALWRQMDNVTIKAPENEVIRRIVITDLRPDKDGDVRVVEGGEGQKNVTIELKSPTVLRGYEFHIEVYSTPEENTSVSDDQKSTTEFVQDASTTAIPNNDSATNLDVTSELPDPSTQVPAILSSDGIKDNERQGRNAKNDGNTTSEGTTESTSTNFNTGISTTPTTQQTESGTENLSEKNTDALNNFKHDFTIPPIPLNTMFNNNPAIPAISGKDIPNDKSNISGDNETRHVRDTEKESGNPSEKKLNPTVVQFESTENDKEATTEISETSTEENQEENLEEKNKETVMTDPKPTTFDNRKYTSIISTKVNHPDSHIHEKDVGILRNVRGANEEQKMEESTTTTSDITTTDLIVETSTLSSDDCVTTETSNIQHPVNFGTDNTNIKTGQIPIYLNSREWNQRLNNPTLQVDGSHSPAIMINPAVLNNAQSTLAPETDAEHLGNGYKPTPDHMESKNPKISAIASQRNMK